MNKMKKGGKVMTDARIKTGLQKIKRVLRSGIESTSDILCLKLKVVRNTK